MSTNRSIRRMACAASLALTLGSYGIASHAAARIVFVNTNAAGVGFNDPTPVAPVGGNRGRTLGEQRINVFMAAAGKWGATLTSVPEIRIEARFIPLNCTANTAVLGSAAPLAWVRDFLDFDLLPPPNYQPNTYYPLALGNKLSGVDLDEGTSSEIRAQFNSNIGQANCLTGTSFYLGLDNNHGTNVDLYTILLHEFAHGLGFTTSTSVQSGAQLNGFPNIFDNFVQDKVSGDWNDLADAQRAASATNPRKVVWTGNNAMFAAQRVLRSGSPTLVVTTPASVSGEYLVGAAEFGPRLSIPGRTGQVVRVVDNSSAGNACTPLSAANTAAVTGKIALVDRGTCAITVKVKNVQNAGAVGAILVDTVDGSPPPPIGGTDATVTIPSVRISLADGNRLKTALGSATVNATLSINPAPRSGTDTTGKLVLNTPNPLQPGSSVAHWDPIASRNLLMEPADSGDLTHEVTPPNDITFPMLQDLGW